MPPMASRLSPGSAAMSLSCGTKWTLRPTPYLHAAILLGLGLVTRGRTLGGQGDLEALRDVEGRIEDELRRLEKMEKHNESIRKNSDGIADEIRKAQRQLIFCFGKRRAPSPLSTSNCTMKPSSGPPRLYCRLSPTRLRLPH
jgi:hypothetical protein